MLGASLGRLDSRISQTVLHGEKESELLLPTPVN